MLACLSALKRGQIPSGNYFGSVCAFSLLLRANPKLSGKVMALVGLGTQTLLRTENQCRGSPLADMGDLWK